MFDPQFRLSPDQVDSSTTSDDSSSNGLWPQMSLDRLLEHHDITPAQPISINDTINNDLWPSSAQFKEFFNNYHREYQQQNQPPVDISSFLSSSPPQQQQQPQSQPQHHQQQYQQQQQFSLPFVDNHIFEPQPDSQAVLFRRYPVDNNQLSAKRDSLRQQHQQQQQQQYQQPSPQPYVNRSRQTPNIQRQHQQQNHHRTPPLLQIPNEDHYQQQQQQATGPPRFKQNQLPAYVACLNHGINYNGVSGPPILLPPSF